jgi:hypothetical protein
MKAGVVCAVLLLLVLTGQAKADDAHDANRANRMMVGCHGFIADIGGGQVPNAADALLRGQCLGAIRAIVHFDKGVCTPKGSNLEQWLRVVVQYIDSRPARLHESFFDLAAEALRAAWPCR